jgi:N-acetylmuramoyl-L-alanine amidase
MPPPPNIEHLPSPNHGSRRGQSVDILLLHYTGMPSPEGALKWLRAPASEVSSHYLVFADGRIVQLVEEERRAWHAGRAMWGGETDINSRSIGIEIDNPGHEFGYRAFPGDQVAAVIDLCRDILSRHSIPAERVLAHSDVAPMRKEDPGELFPWQELHAAGIGHWVEPAPIADGAVLKRGDTGEAVLTLQERFRRYGYGLEPQGQFGEETEAVVRAFQRHFRPALVDGIADSSTIVTLGRLIGGQS